MLFVLLGEVLLYQELQACSPATGSPNEEGDPGVSVTQIEEPFCDTSYCVTTGANCPVAKDAVPSQTSAADGATADLIRTATPAGMSPEDAIKVKRVLLPGAARPSASCALI